MKPSHPTPAGHVLVPAIAIGALSIVLVAGLALLGFLARVNAAVSKIASQGESVVYPKSLPEWAVWLAAVVFSFALAFAILSVPGTWRRVVLWVSAAVLTAGWAPVLVLASHAPYVAGPFIAVFWSGVCALVYAGNHRMPADETSATPRP